MGSAPRSPRPPPPVWCGAPAPRAARSSPLAPPPGRPRGGLPDWGVRRVPGLRREEVAQLANVGLTWYTWLEQGRQAPALGWWVNGNREAPPAESHQGQQPFPAPPHPQQQSPGSGEQNKCPRVRRPPAENPGAGFQTGPADPLGPFQRPSRHPPPPPPVRQLRPGAGPPANMHHAFAMLPTRPILTARGKRTPGATPSTSPR